jgi:hypothetical protein
MVNITDPENKKIERNLHWLRWKGTVLERESRLIERLKKTAQTYWHGKHRPPHKPVG